MTRSDNPHDRVSKKAGDWPVWLASLAPPIASITHLQAMTVLEHTACSTQRTIQLHVTSVILLAVVVISGIVARREWTRFGSDDPAQFSGPLGSRRLLALFGMLGSAIFALFILAQWFPAFVLGPCVRT